MSVTVWMVECEMRHTFLRRYDTLLGPLSVHAYALSDNLP